jgi:hypothetical protein
LPISVLAGHLAYVAVGAAAYAHLIVGCLLRSLSTFGCKNTLNPGSDLMVNDGLIVFTNNVNAEFLGGQSVPEGVGQSHEELSMVRLRQPAMVFPAEPLCGMDMVTDTTRLACHFQQWAL